MIVIKYDKVLDLYNSSRAGLGSTYPCTYLFQRPLELITEGQDISDSAKRLLLDLDLIEIEEELISTNQFRFLPNEKN